MKKQISLFVLATAIVGASPVMAATNIGTRAGSSADLTGMPATRDYANVNYEKYQTRTTTRTYSSNDGGNMYYVQPANRSALYKQYADGNSGQTTTVRTTRAETVRTEMKRKYYLAHPFYQPLKGKVGSVTDLSYTNSKYDFNIASITNENADIKTSLEGKDAQWKYNSFSIKEDLSFGVTDRFAIIGMLRYDLGKYEMPIGDAAFKLDDNGLTQYGIGLRWRVVDTPEWIATITPQYQRHHDVVDFAILDAQVGYKVARSTIYGLGRAWYGFYEGNSFGASISGSSAKDGSAFVYIPYKENTDHMLYIEGGAGVFSVLDEDWTMNLEATFGHYDWHNQLAIKAAIGWQPNDWFALNLYGRVALYDTADGQTKNLWWQEVNETTGVNLPSLTNIGTVKMDNNSDFTVGLQVIFEF